MKLITEKVISWWHKYWGSDLVLAMPHSEKLDKHLMQTLLALHYLRDVPITYGQTNGFDTWKCASHSISYYGTGYFILNGVHYYSRPNHKLVELLRRVKCKKDISKLVLTEVAEGIQALGHGRS